MEESILNTTKKALGIDEEYDVFDETIIMHINSVFATLHQLGIGPVDGFMITDANNVWGEFMEDDRFNSVRTYVYLSVRVLFDPPQTSYHLAAINEQIKQLEWRLNVVREGDVWGILHPVVEEEIP